MPGTRSTSVCATSEGVSAEESSLARSRSDSVFDHSCSALTARSSALVPARRSAQLNQTITNETSNGTSQRTKSPASATSKPRGGTSAYHAVDQASPSESRPGPTPPYQQLTATAPIRGA